VGRANLEIDIEVRRLFTSIGRIGCDLGRVFGGQKLQVVLCASILTLGFAAWDERYALLTVLIAAFGRAISEVGAVMVVGGNIEGFTRVMTTAIALETSKGDLPLALALGLVLMSVVLLLNVLISFLRRWRQRIDGAGADPVQGVLV
jgi:tungstate transport system permease protein